MEKILDTFFDKLKNIKSRLLLLDYDGTLAPFRKERDKAFPYPGVEIRLDSLISSEYTEVVIISGRAIKDLKPLLRLKKYPEIWGSHGWEHLDKHGSYRLKRADINYITGMEKAKKYITNNNLADYLELKPASLAIHYRGIDSNKTLVIKKRILHNWSELEAEYLLVYSEFDGGLELKIPGFNKGDVIRSIIKNRPEKASIAYLGDDLTDEDAFKALPETEMGILVRNEARPTAAKTRISPPKELLEFLDRWVSLER